MQVSTYRDMELLNELALSPDATQRELSKRIGVALGLTNLMLRRLVKKGYVKISGTKRSRIRYLITPQGILEKSRLTYEFIQYSLQLYSRVRHFLREQLSILSKSGHRKILLYGKGELAEIAFLVIREIGLELVGVVDEAPVGEHFLGYAVQRLGDVPLEAYDRLIVVLLHGGTVGIGRLVEAGVPLERMIILPIPGVQSLQSPRAVSGAATSAAPSGSTFIPATEPHVTAMDVGP